MTVTVLLACLIALPAVVLACPASVPVPRELGPVPGGVVPPDECLAAHGGGRGVSDWRTG